MQPEIYAYFEEVAKKYDLRPHVRFHSVVEKARWEGETASWVVTCRNLNTKQSFQRRCKILISAVGALSVPKKCDIPGASRYQGRMFHSAEWDHSFNWEGKEVITIGKTNALPLRPFSNGESRERMQRNSVRARHK